METKRNILVRLREDRRESTQTSEREETRNKGQREEAGTARHYGKE